MLGVSSLQVLCNSNPLRNVPLHLYNMESSLRNPEGTNAATWTP